jgi:hypothetical protein
LKLCISPLHKFFSSTPSENSGNAENSGPCGRNNFCSKESLVHAHHRLGSRILSKNILGAIEKITNFRHHAQWKMYGHSYICSRSYYTSCWTPCPLQPASGALASSQLNHINVTVIVLNSHHVVIAELGTLSFIRGSLYAHRSIFSHESLMLNLSFAGFPVLLIAQSLVTQPVVQ